MKRALLLVSTIVAAVAVPSLADGLRLEGETFRPTAEITWGATNVLPRALVVYKRTPLTFSQTVISNAMSVGSFTLLNKLPSEDKTTMRFQDKRDKIEMTRFLEISATRGWVNYYDGRAEGKASKGVPTFEVAEKLAVDYLLRFGVNTNQIIARPWPRTQTTVTSFDKKGGRETDKSTNMRGVFLFRQIDGIEVAGNSFWIHFCQDAKPSMFELTWPNLEPVQHYGTATPAEIIRWLKAGRAVNPNPDAMTIQDKPLRITKIVPRYLGKVGISQMETLHPYAQIEVVADFGKTNQAIFTLNCPIIDEGKPMLSK